MRSSGLGKGISSISNTGDGFAVSGFDGDDDNTGTAGFRTGGMRKS
jgi:hypothetical protein